MVLGFFFFLTYLVFRNTFTSNLSWFYSTHQSDISAVGNCWLVTAGLSLDKRGPGAQTLAGFPHTGEEHGLKAKYGSSSEASVDPGPTSYQLRPWANNEELLILLNIFENFMSIFSLFLKTKRKRLHPIPALGHFRG